MWRGVSCFYLTFIVGSDLDANNDFGFLLNVLNLSAHMSRYSCLECSLNGFCFYFDL